MREGFDIEVYEAELIAKAMQATDGSECWFAMNKYVKLDDHDAALRRAKAEGLRLAVQEHRCWEDVLRTEYRNVPTFEAWIDARAAQIEANEQEGT